MTSLVLLEHPTIFPEATRFGIGNESTIAQSSFLRACVSLLTISKSSWFKTLFDPFHWGCLLYLTISKHLEALIVLYFLSSDLVFILLSSVCYVTRFRLPLITRTLFWNFPLSLYLFLTICSFTQLIPFCSFNFRLKAILSTCSEFLRLVIRYFAWVVGLLIDRLPFHMELFHSGWLWIFYSFNFSFSSHLI